jgi:hypothetical protein
MRHIFERDWYGWYDRLNERKSKNDPCAYLRVFIIRVDKWLWNLTQEDQVDLRVACGAVRTLKEDAELAIDFFWKHFTILGKETLKQFVQDVESSAGYFLRHYIHAVWRDFCGSLQHEYNCDAFERTKSSMDVLDEYLRSSAAHKVILSEYNRRVELSWEHVQIDILRKGYQFIPFDVIASLWHALADFVEDVRVKHNFPDWSRRSTDVEEGRLRDLMANTAVTDTDATRSADARNSEFAWHLAAHTSNLRQGRVSEAQLLEVLSLLLIAANELALKLDAPASHREVSQLQSRERRQKPDTVPSQQEAADKNVLLKEEVARWAEALAPFVYNAYPAMSLTAIAVFLASAEARSNLADQLTDRHAKALLKRGPPRDDANWRSIYNKLLHAIKQGRLQNCPRPKTRTKITKS